MKRMLFLLLLIPALSIAQQDTERERLKEEIRKEIEEERQREQLEQELRNEILKEEQEAKERQEILEAKAKAQIEHEKNVARNAARSRSSKPQRKQAPDSLKYARRLTGWSIDAAIGPNFPLGKFSSKSGPRGHYATSGVGLMLNNHVMFTKVIGISLSLGFEHNAYAGLDLIDDLRESTGNQPNIRMTIEATPYQQYTVGFGPTIRHLGSGAAFIFRPYLGFSTRTGGEYTVFIRDGNNPLGAVSLDLNPSVALLVGASTELAIHLGKSSDLCIGLRLNMAWRKVGYKITSSNDPEPDFGWEDMEFIRFAPMIGYRFHL